MKKYEIVFEADEHETPSVDLQWKLILKNLVTDGSWETNLVLNLSEPKVATRSVETESPLNYFLVKSFWIQLMSFIMEI